MPSPTSAHSSHYAHSLYSGRPVNKYKDKHGERLTDKYLARRLSVLHPWVERVYEETSEFIHFTSRNIFQAMGKLDDEERSFEMLIAARDRERPEQDYFEIVHAFDHVTYLVAQFSAEWYSAIHPDRKFVVEDAADDALTAVPTKSL